jgi:hypothetical protein
MLTWALVLLLAVSCVRLECSSLTAVEFGGWVPFKWLGDGGAVFLTQCRRPYLKVCVVVVEVVVKGCLFVYVESFQSVQVWAPFFGVVRSARWCR